MSKIIDINEKLDKKKILDGETTKLNEGVKFAFGNERYLTNLIGIIDKLIELRDGVTAGPWYEEEIPLDKYEFSFSPATRKTGCITNLYVNIGSIYNPKNAPYIAMLGHLDKRALIVIKKSLLKTLSDI